MIDSPSCPLHWTGLEQDDPPRASELKEVRALLLRQAGEPAPGGRDWAALIDEAISEVSREARHLDVRRRRCPRCRLEATGDRVLKKLETVMRREARRRADAASPPLDPVQRLIAQRALGQARARWGEHCKIADADLDLWFDVILDVIMRVLRPEDAAHKLPVCASTIRRQAKRLAALIHRAIIGGEEDR